MMELNRTYNRDDFLHFLGENFLIDFKKDIRPVSTQGLSSLQKAYSLGRSESLDLQVFEFSFEGSPNKRVALTKDAFQIMRSYAIFQALAIFHSPNSNDWRLSLMTATPERTEKGKVSISYSNPKRLSFFLGPNAKVNTPTKFLLKMGNVVDLDNLKKRFSIEVVNKEFYREISELFTQLVGGSVYMGRKRVDYDALLKLPSIQDKSQTSLEFAVRLIGRVIFCWFLREKKSDKGKSLMPNNLLSFEAVKKNPDYYHNILEPIFFEVLNKPVLSRKDDYASEPFSSIPYLNGGLFSPHDDDFFSYNEGKQTVNYNVVIIPDEWLRKFFAVLETYNFTIDENTSFDEELSIDPEMLGRIFENLLAEINPETGESARKSTGSYYTPRVIVDYMVDESLLVYLKQQTQIDTEKLRAILSYDLHDDEENPLSENERERIISALEKVKILDPACGSGAFPIGALQKIVFILQQADPVGQLWFKKQIKNTSPEIRRVLEREFAHKNFDYIRKLGIIRENIYGVDIQPIATEISRLRCFLTLVVDERIQEDLENRGIEPLPNLDFKFVTANSLIGLPGSQSNSQIGLFEDDEGIRELKELRDMFFTAFGAERDQLKLQFVQAQKQMLQRMIAEGRRGYADLTSMLSSWNPFSHKASLWFDSAWMFGIEEGFDIIIANPPYIGEKGNEGIFHEVVKTDFGKKYYSRWMDYFYFFFHKALARLCTFLTQ
jgi:adenine-specific DNA-methyltransferase